MQARFSCRAILASALSVFAFGCATAATLTVNTNADPSTGDGLCSLREAIASINAGANQGDCVATNLPYGSSDAISFNISGAGVHTIALASSLPAIVKPMTIDGLTQAGASANTNGPGQGNNAVLLIEINATNVGNGGDTGALTVNAGGGGTTIQGLVINRYVVSGIALTDSGGNNFVRSNFIGVDPTGASALTLASSQYGVDIAAISASEDGDTIGGGAPANANVIAGNNVFGQIATAGSGSHSNHQIVGNFIGTNAAGTASLSIPGCVSSAQAGVKIGTNAVNGQITGNLISGNCARGIQLGTGPGSGVTGIAINGNLIGTDVTGTLPLGNQAEAVELFGALNTNVTGNVIAAAKSTANNGTGIDIEGGNGTTILDNSIGTDLTGTRNLGNDGHGIAVSGTTRVTIGNQLGAGDYIAFNGCCIAGGGAGIFIASGTGTEIRGVRIFSNTGLGIDIAPAGPNPNNSGNPINDGQNYPVITAAALGPGNSLQSVQGTLNSIPSTPHRITIFASSSCDPSGFGEGQANVTAIDLTTDGAGNAAFSVSSLGGVPGPFITATATRNPLTAGAETSEFSQCFQATGAASPTTTTLVSSLNPSTLGQSVTFTATVTGSSPTGTMQFKDGATNLGSPVALSGGIASFTTSSLTAGTHPISAVYGGDANNQTSTSNTVSQVVNAAGPGTTTTTLVSSLNPSTFGQPVAFTATVTGSGPTGTVQFRDGATNLGSPVALVGNVATFTTSSLAVGTHPITAVYSGDANNQTSTSNTISQVVNPVATTTTLVSSQNPSTIGQAVTFTATVAGSSPTGTVQFRDGATLLGSATLSGGVATFTTSSLTVGTHPITAVYGGDANNQTSTSNTVNQVVNGVVGPTITPVPTLGEWALVMLALLVLAAGAIVLVRRS